MMFTMIMGLRFKLDIDFIASAILLTMVGAVLTIPLFQLLIG
jgi:predicted permease